MTGSQREQVAGCIAEARAITEEARASFEGLSAEQLNWKPGADRWSVGQCLDHLVTTNATYFPGFEAVLKGEHRSTVWERLPLLPAFWGTMLRRAVAPESPRKFKAPKIFQPASSSVDGEILRRFVDQQEQVIRYMETTAGRDLEEIKITSPISRLVTYSLLDAYRILVTHERRHLLQARRVTETEGFPQGG